MSISIGACGLSPLLSTIRRGPGTRAPEYGDEVSASFSADGTLAVTASDPARAEPSSHFNLRARRQEQRNRNWHWRVVCRECDQVDPSLASAHQRKSGSVWGAERKDESIPAFMGLSALKLHYTDVSFISRLGLTGREVGVLQQVRAAVVAAHPGGSLRTNPATSNRQYPSLCLPRFPFLQLTPLTSRANETPCERLPSLCSRRLRRVQR